MEKTEKWKKSLKQTKEKRKSQTCRVFSLKFDKDKLTQAKLAYLNLLFEEAKLVYNDILASPDIFKFDSKITQVNALDKEKNPVIKELKVIGSQMKQSVHRRIVSSIKTLSKLKKSNKKVGRLKFRSRINSITLDQFNVTYKFNDNYLRLQGNRNMRFKLIGFNQIPENAEFANANIIRKTGDFYLKVTTFVPRAKQEVFQNEIVGIDAGCSTVLTLSDGTKYNVKFPVCKRTKFLQKTLKNKKKYSHNYFKHLTKIEKSIDRNSNKKKDKINKIVFEITKKHKCICMQDENVKGWMGQHGKAVQSSSVSGIIAALRSKAHTFVEVDRFFASTQICNVCGNRQKLDLWQRVYDCPFCGSKMDRDINSAINIMLEGKKQLPMEYRDVKPVELMTSAVSNNGKLLTMNQEALLSLVAPLINQRQELEV